MENTRHTLKFTAARLLLERLLLAPVRNRSRIFTNPCIRPHGVEFQFPVLVGDWIRTVFTGRIANLALWVIFLEDGCVFGDLVFRGEPVAARV
jgi:hypothetical protein